jgi:hypothetical protein
VPRQGHCPLLLRTGAPRLQWQQLFSLVLPAPAGTQSSAGDPPVCTLLDWCRKMTSGKAWCGRWPVFFAGVVSVLFWYSRAPTHKQRGRDRGNEGDY